MIDGQRWKEDQSDLLRCLAAFHDDSSRRSKGQFRRGGTSLYKTLPISLSDALLGFERNLTHMDGRTVTVKRDGVTQTGFVSVVDNEGMPVQGTSLSEASDDEMRAGRDMLFGKLYIEWQLVLPRPWTRLFERVSIMMLFRQ